MKNGVPSVFSRMSCFRVVRTRPSLSYHLAQQKREEFLRLFSCRTAQAAVGCNTSSAPTPGDTPGDSSPAAGSWPTGHTLTQRIEKPLRLAVDPVQVLKDENERLIETLAQEELLERLKRPPPPNLRVHLLQRRGLLLNAQQRKEIGQRVFQAAVQASTLCP